MNWKSVIQCHKQMIESNQIKTQKIGNCTLLIAYSKIFVGIMNCINSLVNEAPKQYMHKNKGK